MTDTMPMQMPIADKLFLQTPIALRPGVVVHLSDENETIIIDKDRTIPFIGKFFSLAIRHLATPTTVDQFTRRFTSTREQTIARLVLKKLLAERILIFGEPGRFQWLYSDYIILGGPLGFRGYVAVSPAGDFAASSVELFYEALNGIGIETALTPCIKKDGCINVVLISSTKDISATLSSIESPVLLIILGREQIIAGPFMRNASAEWPDLQNRVESMINMSSLQSEMSTASKTLNLLGLNWSAIEVMLWLADSSLKLHPQQLRSFEFGTAKITEHGIFGLEPELPWDLDLTEDGFTKESQNDLTSFSLRSNNDERTLKALLPTVSRLAGIIPFLQEVSNTALPVYITMHNNGSHQRSRLGLAPGLVAASGKGYSVAAAKVSCIGEALERFSCGYSRNAPILNLPFNGLDDLVVHPRQILAFSENQYLNRSTEYDVIDGKPIVGFNWVPPPYRDAEPVGWTRGVNVLTRRPVYLPAALMYFNYDNPGEHHYGFADSNGCAAGANLAEALLHALLELVERDACAIWWYNQIQRNEISLEKCSDQLVQNVLKTLASRGRKIYVLDISTDLGIPVCASVSFNSEGKIIHIGLGASMTMAGAVRRALAEMVQVGVIDIEAASQTPTDPIQKDMLSWYRNATIENFMYLKPSGSLDINWTERFEKDTAQSLTDLLNIISEQNLSVYAANMSRKNLPVKVVRAVVPGLRHFWRRLAPGRLYEVPVKAGWLPKQLKEVELNPVSFFL